MSASRTAVKLKPENIPHLLKSLDQWLVWKAFNEKRGGKYDKVPVCPNTGFKINGLSTLNHMSFETALQAYQKGIGDGLGFALTGDPVISDESNNDLYLIGLDLDRVNSSPEILAEAEKVVRALGSYFEVSPSGTGIRIFALCKQKVGRGAGLGGEMYHQNRFLTITGRGTNKAIVDATDQLKKIESNWWPSKNQNKAKIEPPKTDAIIGVSNAQTAPWPEEPEYVKRVEELLSWVPADCQHDIWRDVIWSVASLGWECGEEILSEWSSRDKNRWSTNAGALEAQTYLSKLYEAFDPTRGITLGTLTYHAHLNGRPKQSLEHQVWPSPCESAGRKFNILNRNDLDQLPSAQWLVHGILPTKGVATIFGPSMAGKSFLAIDLAATLTNGENTWFGRMIKKVPGLYIALEGGAGIKKRIKAWELRNGVRAKNLQYLMDPFNILNDAEVTDLITQIVPSMEGGIIFLDTLAQSAVGFDENSSSDMGRALSAAQAIAKNIKGLVVLVHHTGKDARRGLRGHSSLMAAMDAAIEVKGGDFARLWKTAKVKDGDDTVAEGFNLIVEAVGIDEFGLVETSCAVEPCSKPNRINSPTGKNQKKALAALVSQLSNGGALSEDEAFDVVKTVLTDIDSNHRSSRAKAAIKALGEAGHIKISGGEVCIPPPDHHRNRPP